ncbi:MAG: hypothetical protein ACXVFV_06785, partial [Mycobacteriales bacterium]
MTLVDSSTDQEAPPRAPAPSGPPWTVRYVRRVLAVDVLALTVAGLLAVLLRFGSEAHALHHVVSYYVVAADIELLWLA